MIYKYTYATVHWVDPMCHGAFGRAYLPRCIWKGLLATVHLVGPICHGAFGRAIGKAYLPRCNIIEKNMYG